jgi:hypothetical protein
MDNLTPHMWRTTGHKIKATFLNSVYDWMKSFRRDIAERDYYLRRFDPNDLTLPTKDTELFVRNDMASSWDSITMKEMKFTGIEDILIDNSSLPETTSNFRRVVLTSPQPKVQKVNKGTKIAKVRIIAMKNGDFVGHDDSPGFIERLTLYY